jgi:hypothetical protein
MNADNPNKKTVTLNIQDKTFNINFTSNYVVHAWNEQSKEISRVNSMVKELSDIQGKIESGTVTIAQATKRIEEITEAVNEIGSAEFFARRLDIVAEILITNAYEFDREWWERRTEPSDVITFIVSSISKDVKKN